LGDLKATEAKYLVLLESLTENPRATHADLSTAADVPPSLVNRYLKRLADWGAVRASGGRRRTHEVTAKGRRLIEQASWEFVSFSAGLIETVRRRAIDALSSWTGKRAVVYGAVPLAGFIERWAADAGLEVVARCDEERPGRNVVRLDDLAQIEYDVIILADWDLAEDGMLARLLTEFGTVVNPFAVDGAARPQWR
jgi:predicted transcriptional regulator